MSPEKWLKVGKGALIALAGAALAYATEAVIPMLNGSSNAVVLALGAAASVLVNVARKWLEGEGEEWADS